MKYTLKHLPPPPIQPNSPLTSWNGSGLGSSTISLRSHHDQPLERPQTGPPNEGVLGQRILSSSPTQDPAETLDEPSRSSKPLGLPTLCFSIELVEGPETQEVHAEAEPEHSGLLSDRLSTCSAQEIPIVPFASSSSFSPASLPDTESSLSISTVSSTLSSRFVCSPVAPATATTDAHRLLASVLDFRAFQSLLSTESGRTSFRAWLAEEAEINKLGLAKLDRWVDETRADALVKNVREYSISLYSLYHNQRAGAETNVVVPKNVNESALSNLSQLATLDSGLGKTSAYLLKSLYGNEFQGFIHAKSIDQTRISLSQESDPASSFDSFCLCNPRLEDNPVVMISIGFSELTGYEPAEMIGRNMRLLERKQSRSFSDLREVVAERRSACALVLYYKKDGTPFYCLQNVVPLFDSKGELMFYIIGQAKVTGEICGSTEFFEPRSASFPTVGSRRSAQLEQPDVLPSESPRMRDHEQQLSHYHHRRPPSSRTMRSTTSLARSHTGALSDADSTSRSFVNPLKFALRKTPLSPTRSAIPELEAEPGSAIAALGSGLGPFEERVSIFKSAFSQLLIFERHSYKVVYINRDCLPFFGLPTESEEDALSPAILHHNFLESIHGENAKRTKELRALVHDGVMSGQSVSCQCVLKWDLGVKLKPNSLRQTYTRLQHKSSYQSSYSCSIYLTPIWTMSKKCVVYTALVM